MRVAFAGTPEFAAVALRAISGAGHTVPLVLTQPDRPSGRGLKLTPSPVGLAAQALGFPVSKFPSLRSPEAHETLRGAAADVLVVAAYGLILPKAVLEIPRFGCLNIHASLLPRWRGAAPIHRAILAGDNSTGVCIMLMDEGLDTGDVLLKREIGIAPTDTTGSLTERLATLGAEAILAALGTLDTLVRQPQEAQGATYAAKITKAEARIAWEGQGAVELERKIRAFNPAPGVEARVGGELVKIWGAEVTDQSGPPGTLLRAASGELIVACATGSLRLTSLQRPGGRRLAAAEFLRGVVSKSGIA